MSQRSPKSIGALLGLLLAASVSGQDETGFRVAGATRRGRRVISVGVRFDAGDLTGGRVPIVGPGAPSAAQLRPVTLWEDGSVRHAVVSFRTRLAPGSSRRFAVAADLGARAPRGSVTLTREGDDVVVRSSLLSLTVPGDAGVVLERLSRREPGRPRVASIRFANRRGVTAELTVEEAGPLRAVVLKRGVLESEESGERLDFATRVVVADHAACVDVETWISARGVRGRRPAVDLVLDLGAPPRRLLTGAGASSLRGPMAVERDRRGPSRVTADGDVIEEGEAVTGAVRVLAGRRSVELAVRDFEGLGPGRIAVDPEGGVRVGLVSEAYGWWPGVRPRKALRIALPATSRGRAPEPFEEIVVIPGARALTPFAGPLKSALGRPRVSARLTRDVFAELEPAAGRRNGFVWPGEEDFGDWRWSKSDAGNLEYDTTWGLAAAGAGRRRADLMRASVRAARHLVSRDLDRSGLPLRHGAFHRLGGLEVGHIWFEGLAAVAAASGDLFLLDAWSKMASAWRSYLSGLEATGLNTRSLGWGLLSASVVADWTREPEDLEILAALQRGVAAAPGGAVPLLDRLAGEERPYHVSPWVTGGILVEGALAANRLRPDPAVVHRCRLAVRELARCAWNGRTRTLARSLIYSGETGDLLGVSKTCTGEEMLFFALGLARTAERGGGDDLRVLAADVATAAADRLRLSKKHFRGMETSQLLWVLPRLFGPAL